MIAKLLVRLFAIPYRVVRISIIKTINRLEGGECYSTSLREIFRKYYKVEIGMYTHGDCFDITYGQTAPYTTIGRYCSFAHGARVLTADHPLSHKSTHGFFFNPDYGLCSTIEVRCIPKVIGNDVWIGHNAVILKGAKCIGDGAVIGANAVVNKDVPPYAVVVGNPARIVQYRFSPDVIEELLQSRWWEKSVEELRPELHEFIGPYKQIKD